MSQIVKCEVCGGLFNQRYLVSHKRLAHREKRGAGEATKVEPETINTILSLYKQLSLQGQKDLIDRLIKATQESQ